MNLPATLSFSAAVVGLLIALLTLVVSAGPGWRELRAYSLAAFLAAGFAATEALSTLGVSAYTAAWASRVGLALTGAHGAAWYLYGAARRRRPLLRHERVVVAVGLLLGGLALVPGVVLSDRLSVRPVPWLGVTYHDAVPTAFSTVVYLFDIGAMVGLIAGYVKEARAREPQAMLHVVGLGLLCLAGIHDSVVASYELPLPYLVGLGCLAAGCCVGAAIAMRFVEQSRALVRASADLEAAQQALVRRERLAALGELAAVIAHEVRNPVGVIFNATATLQHDPTEGDRAALLGIIEEEATRLGRIVDDLLLFTRPSLLAEDVVDVGDLARGAVRAAIEVGPEVAPRVDVAVAPGLTMQGDERMLRQALINLVTNALQAAPEGSVVIRARRAGGEVVLEVCDDGPGVPEEDRERIFAPFFTTRATGTGLGLAIVRRIAEEHRGRITVEDGDLTPGNGGVRFVLRLPAGPPVLDE
ncbi:MAG: HAMP domain-containing sensor histidine kinase [Polyangiaceae bacterium]